MCHFTVNKSFKSFVRGPGRGRRGCGNSDTAQASNRDGEPKPVAVAIVQKASVPRAVDVVGTLAAVDQVTVSSEADGKVQKIHADLGDPVRAGQVLIQLDDEKQRYAYEQQQATLARALAQYGAPDPEHLPDIEQTPEAQRTQADLAQATQAFDRANELFKRTLIPQQALDDARTAVETKKATYDASLHNARNLRASIQASQATMKLAAAAAARRRDPRAVRRLRREAAGQPRRTGQGADAGHGDRPARSARR